MRLVLPYRTNLIELPCRVRGISSYDMESVVLDVALQPRITMGGNTPGEIIEKIDGVVVGNSVVKDATGFSHREYGLAVRKSVKGFELYTKDSQELCEEVKTAKIDGAFLVACYRDGYTSVYLATFDNLAKHGDIYKSKPARASIGFQSASIVFEDLRSVIIYQGGFAEVGMPIDATAYFEGVFYGSSAGWIVSIDVHSTDARPLIKADNVRFAGFLENLPVFCDGKSFYVLDGGSLVKRGDAVGEVTAWKNTVVADAGEKLVVMDGYGKVLADIPKDQSARCLATKHGVVCYRDNLLGIVDYSSRSYVEAYPMDSEDHSITVSADTTSYIMYKDSRCRIDNQKAVITDREASVLREHVFDLTVSHLLGDEYVFVRSPAKKVSIDVGSVRLFTSTGVHRCGGLSVLGISLGRVSKPSRVELQVMGRPLAEEICLDRGLLDEVDIEAVDTVASDRVLIARVKPDVVFIEEPKTSFDVVHRDRVSVITSASDPSTTVNGVKICCSRVCRDLPATTNSSSMSFEVRDCRLPAWVEVEVERDGFLFHRRFEVEVPTLIDEALKALAEGVVKEYRLGGFYATAPVIDYPDIPPIHRVRARILTDKLEISFSSRTIARGLILAGSRVKPVVIKNGENSFEVPFSSKIVLVIDAGRKWVYSLELTPETLLKAGYRHAQMLKSALRF